MDKISTKLKRKFKKANLQKVINIAEITSAKERLCQIDTSMKSIIDKNEYDPSHKIYMMAQNVLSFFTEEFSALVEFSEFCDTVVQVEDEFMPSGPPMSPLTGSYYSFWCFCDLAFGSEKETICSIFHDLAVEHEYDAVLLKAVKHLDSSYMGFYTHCGFDGDMILLKEIMTNKEFRCICPAGYKGKKDEIWYVRLAPNLDAVYNYHIVINTPYVIQNTSTKDWVNYFSRQGITVVEKHFDLKLIDLLKHHPDFKYWHNYIMDAYVDYSKVNVMLTGIPDIKGSKPHEI